MAATPVGSPSDRAPRLVQEHCHLSRCWAQAALGPTEPENCGTWTSTHRTRVRNGAVGIAPHFSLIERVATRMKNTMKLRLLRFLPAPLLMSAVAGCGEDSAGTLGTPTITTANTSEQQPTASQSPAPSTPVAEPVPEVVNVAGPGSAPTDVELPVTPNVDPPVVETDTEVEIGAEPEPDTPEPSPVAPEPPIDCSAIANAGFELCDSSEDSCSVVFEDGAGCGAVCASAGLSCVQAWENLDGQCAPDTGLGMTTCQSGHESDFCVCGAPGVPPEAPAGEPQPSTEPEPDPEPTIAEPEVEPEPDPEPEVEPEPETPVQPDVGPRSCGCDPPAGESDTQVSSTIVVEAGQTFDGQCLIYRANPGTLGNGSQDEGQSPVFRVNNGGTLRNVVLGASAADGIHIYGDGTLENVHWLDIGEDAMTIKEPGTVYLDCGSAVDGEDKVFQVNAETELHISNFTARNAGKFLRQNGGTDFRIDVFIDHCDISEMDEVIFRTDSTSSFVTLTNTRYSRLGDGLFMFGSNVVNGNSGQSSVSNNEQY